MNSEGLPLDVVLDQLHQNGIVPDWSSFIEDAIKCGWNLGSLRSKIETSTGDVYGPEHRDEVLRKYDLYINKRA